MTDGETIERVYQRGVDSRNGDAGRGVIGKTTKSVSHKRTRDELRITSSTSYVPRLKQEGGPGNVTRDKDRRGGGEE